LTSHQPLTSRQQCFLFIRFFAFFAAFSSPEYWPESADCNYLPVHERLPAATFQSSLQPAALISQALSHQKWLATSQSQQSHFTARYFTIFID